MGHGLVEMSDMEQRSEEWLAWRKQGVCGSEISALTGVSPYLTEYQLAGIKKHGEKKDASNPATWKGEVLEPEAINWYELTTGQDISQDAAHTLVVHPEHPEIRASLDGYIPDLDANIEIKYIGKEAFAALKDVERVETHDSPIPIHHYDQMQYGMLASQRKVCIYLAYREGAGHVVVVFANSDYQEMLKAKALLFWQLYIVGDKMPPLSDQDTLVLEEPSEVEIFTQLKQAKSAAEAAEARYKDLRAFVESRLTHPRVECVGVTLAKNKKGEYVLRVKEES